MPVEFYPIIFVQEVYIMTNYTYAESMSSDTETKTDRTTSEISYM